MLQGGNVTPLVVFFQVPSPHAHQHALTWKWMAVVNRKPQSESHHEPNQATGLVSSRGRHAPTTCGRVARVARVAAARLADLRCGDGGVGQEQVRGVVELRFKR